MGGSSGLSTLSSIECNQLLQQRIRSHFYWSALLHCQDININVRDGRVTLVGTVNIWLERWAAAADAFARSVHEVNSNLRLPMFT